MSGDTVSFGVNNNNTWILRQYFPTLDWISQGNLAKNGKSLGSWKLIMVEEAVSWLRDWDRRQYDPLLDAGICGFPLYEDSEYGGR
jgi:hypothetical protein